MKNKNQDRNRVTNLHQQNFDDEREPIESRRILVGNLREVDNNIIDSSRRIRRRRGGQYVAMLTMIMMNKFTSWVAKPNPFPTAIDERDDIETPPSSSTESTERRQGQISIIRRTYRKSQYYGKLMPLLLFTFVSTSLYWMLLTYTPSEQLLVVSTSAMNESERSVIPHTKYKIHLWNDSSPIGGKREKLYNQEGWSNHPRTQLVDSPNDADLIVWVTTRGNTEAEIPPRNYSNTPVVLLDYADGCSLHQKRGEILNIWGYFKRSFVERNEGLYTKNCSFTREENVYPLAYSGAKAIMNDNISKPRKYLITNVLRTESDHNKGRAKIVNWTKAFIKKHGLEDESYVGGDIGTGYSASDWDKTYMNHLANSKVIVTANPWEWEGDFRLWESLASGAMVMVDHMKILDFMPDTLEDKKHLVFYNSSNLTEFEELLGYYVHHEEEARIIGEAGYRFVMEHHMTTDRVTYILDTLESKKLHVENEEKRQRIEDKGIASAFVSASSQNSADWESKDSVVMGMALGYSIEVFKQFVGSLRATGYFGHIILGISPDASQQVWDYLLSQQVTVKVVEEARNCTHNGALGYDGEPNKILNTKNWHCPRDYPDYKITWARFALYRDWLQDCLGCTDGVVLTDVRDVFFQRDPFTTAAQLNMQHPLMLFEETENLDNTHWLTDFPVKLCRDFTVGQTPVLCSGSTMGSREGILQYLSEITTEFEYWTARPKCRIDMPGDDQSIHNYLFYSGRLKNAITVPHRTGPIHVIGWQAARILERAEKEAKQLNESTIDFYNNRQNSSSQWLPAHDGLIDLETGLVTNLDGQPSAQVHQVDRFGYLNLKWLHEMNEQGWPHNQEGVEVK